MCWTRKKKDLKSSDCKQMFENMMNLGGQTRRVFIFQVLRYQNFERSGTWILLSLTLDISKHLKGISDQWSMINDQRCIFVRSPAFVYTVHEEASFLSRWSDPRRHFRPPVHPWVGKQPSSWKGSCLLFARASYSPLLRYSLQKAREIDID